ncbi:hypothetical protein FACUT_3242 [Fusarium acutatum]|uniref:DUF6603 domain-containing protein n=1 Tax=Fusarium acutatum TaxID=78861 RepID=A0A8H4K026_9HYPO|nr:hypothetical protein FACUT_3242 [Fusarium acutatum]
MDQLPKVEPGEAQILSYFKPGLLPDLYTVHVEQTISSPSKSDSPITLKTKKQFNVQGPNQYQLPPGSVQSVYPAQAEAVGSRILPNIVLSNPHLAWELNPDESSKVSESLLGGTPIPWLALLVFTADEINTLPSSTSPLKPSPTLAINLNKKQLQGFKTPSSGPKVQVPLSSEALEKNPSDMLDVVFVNSKTFEAYFSPQSGESGNQPAIARYTYLSHVRRSEAKKPEALDNAPTNTFGITIGHRSGPLNINGTSTAYAHLVSLMGVQDNLQYPVADTSDLTALISLYSWTFSWVPDTEAALDQAIQKLSGNVRPLARVSPLAGSNPDEQTKWVQARTEAGYTFVKHHLPSGEETVALYRGPLIPQISPSDEINHAEPTTHGSSLQIIDTTTGFVDISYSAAWQLGRSLAIQNSPFSMALSVLRTHLFSVYREGPQKTKKDKTKSATLEDLPGWMQKLRSVVEASLKNSGASTASTPPDLNSRWQTAQTNLNSSSSKEDIPTVQPQAGMAAVEAMLKHEIGKLITDRKDDARTAADPSNLGMYLPKIVDFIYNGLLTLKAVPQNYLFPEPDILDTDGIFTFYIDPLWLDALVDGALSVGNHAVVNDDVCKNEIKKALNIYIAEFEKRKMDRQIPVWGVVVCGQLIKSFPSPQIFTGKKATWPDYNLLTTTQLTDSASMSLFDCRPGSLIYGLNISQPPHHQRFAAGTSLDTSSIEVDFPGLTLDTPVKPPAKPIVVPQLKITDSSVFSFKTRCLNPAAIMTSVSAKGNFPVEYSSALTSLALSDKLLELTIQPSKHQVKTANQGKIKRFELYVPTKGSPMLLAPGDGDIGGSSAMIDDEFTPAQTLDSSSGTIPLGHRTAAAQTPSSPSATATDESPPISPQTLNVAKLRGSTALGVTSNPVTTSCQVLNQSPNPDKTITADLLFSIQTNSKATGLDSSQLLQCVRVAFALGAVIPADAIIQAVISLEGSSSSGWSAGSASVANWPPADDEGFGDEKYSGPAFVVDLTAWRATPITEADIVCLVTGVTLSAKIASSALLDVVVEYGAESDTKVTKMMGVDTFQIPVPGGDCSIVLLVDNPPARARTTNETDASYYHNQPTSNSQVCRGTVLRAILIDGGHDGANGGGYKGKNASQLIKQTINLIESQYNLAVFDSRGQASRTFTLRFDGWVITHWDRDHYCGALYLLWEASLEAGDGTCPYIKYDGQEGGITTLYCPTWIDSPIPNSSNKTARGHHPMFGSNDSGRWGIALPPQRVKNRVKNPLNYTKAEYDELGQSKGGCSVPFGSIVCGCENLLGLDLFTNILFNSDIPLATKFGPDCANDTVGQKYRINSVCNGFNSVFGNGNLQPSYGLPSKYPLAEGSKRPILLCIGAMGNVLGCNTVPIAKHATGDNYASIMVVLLWLPSTSIQNDPPRASLFIGGDAYQDTEELVAVFLEQVTVEVMKASHHGSRSSTSVTLLKALMPNKFIISAGNEYGHPSWQIIAFLLTYAKAQQQGTPFYYKNTLQNPFCHTTRFPYYLYMNSQPGKSLTSKDLNLKAYQEKQPEYNKFFDYTCGLHINNQKRLDTISPFWSGYSAWRAGPNPYTILASKDPHEYLEAFNHFNEGVNFDQLFYWFKYKDLEGTDDINDYPYKNDLITVLINIIRAQFSLISPYPFDFDAAANANRTVRQLTVYSRFDSVLDGLIDRVSNEIIVYKEQYVPAEELPETIQPIEPTPVVFNSYLNDHYWGYEPNTSHQKHDFFGSGSIPPSNRILLSNSMGKSSYPPDPKRFFSEQGQTGYSNGCDKISEFEEESTSEMAIESSAKNSSSNMKFQPIRRTGQQNPPKFFSLMEAVSVPEVTASPTGDKSIQIAGIAYTSSAQETLKVSSNDLFSTFQSSSSSTPFMYWPGNCLLFDSPVAATTEGPFAVSLSSKDSTFSCLDTLLFTTNKTKDPGHMLTALSLMMRLLPAFPLNGAPSAQVDKLSATVSVGANQLIFSSALASINSQFGVTSNSLSGIQMRKKQALLALDDDASTASFTMADIFTSAGISPASWIQEALSAVSATLSASNTSTSEQLASRNGLWISSGDVLRATLRLQFEIPEVPTLSKLSTVAPGLASSGRFTVVAKRTAGYAYIGAAVKYKPEVTLQTQIDVSVPGTAAKENSDDVNAFITIKDSSVRMSLVRETNKGSMADLFTWITKTFEASSFSADLESVKAAMQTVSQTGTTTAPTSQSTTSNTNQGKASSTSSQASSSSTVVPQTGSTGVAKATGAASTTQSGSSGTDTSKAASMDGGNPTVDTPATNPTAPGTDQTQSGPSVVKKQSSTTGTTTVTSDFDLSWRSCSIEFNDSSILGISICLDVAIAIGVPSGQQAGFSLDLTWSPRNWFLSATFMPGGGPDTIGEAQTLDPSWELSNWAPPLDKTLASTMSLLNLDPTGTLNAKSVPAYIPTEISLATLAFSSDEVQFRALIKSRDATTTTSSPVSDVPMIPLAQASLTIAVDYNSSNTSGSKFSFDLSGSVELPSVELDKGSPVPTLQASIAYDNGWDFTATARSVRIESLVSLFDEDEQEDVKDFLGQVMLEYLDLEYKFDGSTASALSLDAQVVYDGYSFTLDYDRSSGKAWTLFMTVAKDTGSQKTTTTIGSLLQWLLGTGIDDDIPDFINNASVDLDDSEFALSMSIQVIEGISYMVLSVSFSIDSVGIQIAKIRERPGPNTTQGKQDEKTSPNAKASSPSPDENASTPPATTTSQISQKQSNTGNSDKTIFRIAVNSLPHPASIPLIGQMNAPFTVDLLWLNQDLSPQDIGVINTAAGFENDPIPLSSSNDESVQGSTNQNISYSKGLSFSLVADGVPIISTKPQVTKGITSSPPSPKLDESNVAKSDSQSPNPKLATSNSGDPGPSGTKDAQSTSSKKAEVSKGQAESHDAPAQGPDTDTDMKPYQKNVNGLSISNIGLEYDAQSQGLVIKFDATATLGPLTAELVNFALTISIPTTEQGKPPNLADWANLDIGISLDGLSLSMTGDNLTVAGFLDRIDTASAQGFQGGLGVTFEAYDFTAFASYEDVTDNGQTFMSLMAYAELQGPILKTPTVEIRGISGGFGLGSQLTVPPVTDLGNFPLLMSSSPTPNAINAFAELQGTSGGTQYITPVNGATWVAVGVLGIACETVDISAVLTLALGPQVDEIAILGTATASFPRGASSDKVVAFIELDYSATADITHGSLFIQGSIAPTSFLLNSECRPTGGFIVATWFKPSPYEGDWCITIGGYHPAYQPPAHYPQPPARLGIAWRYSSHLNITGEAYTALTPDALMAGSSLNALFSVGPIGASFDFQADFILYMHPLHYEADVHVSASVWFEVDVLFVHKKVSVSLGADLSLTGPPFAGCVSFDVTVTTIHVRFGDQQQSQPPALSLQDFIDVCMKLGNTDNEQTPEANHILTLNAGGVAPTTAATTSQQPGSVWDVRASTLTFSVLSRIPASAATLTNGTGSSAQGQETPILSRPMQLTADSPGLTTPLTVTITQENSQKHPQTNAQSPTLVFRYEPIQENVPASLWGAYSSDTAPMLDGTTPKATIQRTTGLKISPPVSTWSSNNPNVMPLADLEPTVPTVVNFLDDTTRDETMDPATRLDNGGEKDLARAESAFTGLTATDSGSTETVEATAIETRNTLRQAVLNQWAFCRGQVNPPESSTAGQSGALNMVNQVKYQVPESPSSQGK